MQAVIENICANTREIWEQATLQRGAADFGTDSPLFGKVLAHGYSPEMRQLFTADEFTQLKSCFESERLHGQKATIYGAGTFGLALALILSEAGADVTIYGSRAPTAMARALGILEPQGSAVEPYFHASIPIFRELIESGAPIRKDRVNYYFRGEPDAELIEELGHMPDSNLLVESVSEFGCSSKISFDGFIMSGSGMRNHYVNILTARGVTFVEREVDHLEAVPGHLTFSALGMGRKAIGNGPQVDLPGNRGQMICVEGTDVVDLLKTFPALEESGSVGIPTSAGSVNIVLHYANPARRENPMLIIGATKEPGSSLGKPRQSDYEFLMNGVRELWPQLHAHLEQSTNSTPTEASAAKLNWSTYVCVRPGGGQTPFTIANVDGCIDISGAGGTGNTIAPAAALKALALALT